MNEKYLEIVRFDSWFDLMLAGYEISEELRSCIEYSDWGSFLIAFQIPSDKMYLLDEIDRLRPLMLEDNGHVALP